MKIFLLFYMCHFAMGLTHCYKTTVFFKNMYIINRPHRQGRPPALTCRQWGCIGKRCWPKNFCTRCYAQARHMQSGRVCPSVRHVRVFCENYSTHVLKLLSHRRPSASHTMKPINFTRTITYENISTTREPYHSRSHRYSTLTISETVQDRSVVTTDLHTP